MTIKQTTGKIVLSKSGDPIGPALSRARFLASSLSESSQIWVQNEPWCSYRLAPIDALNTQFYIVLQFQAQSLKSVTLTDGHPRFGTSWDDVTEAKQQSQKVQHDEWLKLWNLSAGSYPWGTVANCIDPHSNSSSIIIRYK